MAKGFRVELVACEPQVVDPVAMAFDERGRIFVAEMRGYPNAGRGTGFVTSGRIRLLEDRDQDGFFETSTLYADDLRFPTGVMPWRGGLIVANAPDLLYLDDPKGQGKGSRRRVLYSGFDVANIQQLLNSPQLGLDNWVHACAGGAGGTIRSAEKKDAPAVTLRGRGIRFLPDVPGSLEPTSGGGQYGLTADEYGHWFVATNSQHLRHVILPDDALRRNPALAVRAVTLDIPEHGAACKVFRKSPFEAWRVERTSRRAGSVDAQRFPSTELVPGGYVTSGCSPLVYTAGLFPKAYQGSVFVCDPANNLILRDTLTPSGATYVAHRGHADCEFLTSTDNWFRPVHLTLGPDGAVYVLDFYREVIETPLSLPEDIKKRVNLQSRARGRIWRITTAPPGTKPIAPNLHRATSKQLVAHMANDNSWYRLTAQRLLLEKQDRSAVPHLESLAASRPSAVGRAHALWTLDGLSALSEAHLLAALKDAEPGVREQAVRLSAKHLTRWKRLAAAVAALADDADPMVRFQTALALGRAEGEQAAAALARIACRKETDSWTHTAILCSAGKSAASILEAILGERALLHEKDRAQLAFLSGLARLIGASADDAQLARALTLLSQAGKADRGNAPLQIALLDGLSQGLAGSSRPLSELWEKPGRTLAGGVKDARKIFAQAERLALDERQTDAERVRAVRLLGHGPFSLLLRSASSLLSPHGPPQLQLATVRALSAQGDPRVATLILAAWPAAGPALRREMTEALFARADRLPALLDAIERKTLLAGQLEPIRLTQLRKHADPKLRARAMKLLGAQGATERAKVIQRYQMALTARADIAQGKKVFQKTCATCHRLDNVGVQVGPDLLAALRNKSAGQLLVDILDPSREVDPRYVSYQLTSSRGQVYTGLIAAETASSVTLRRGEGAEDTILRSQIDTVESTGKSLMPEGLEATLTRQDLADLIGYLLRAGK